MRLFFALGLSLATSVASAATPGPQIPFVPNHGQWTRQVKYAVDLPGGRLFLENSCFTYTLLAKAAHHPEVGADRTPVAGHAFRVTMVGANTAPALTGEARQAAFHNYFLGNNPAHWAAKVPLFAGVRYHEAYPGTDVRWHQQAGSGQLEYDFELAPGANPAAIRLRYDGLDGLAIAPEGHLRLRTSVGELREQAPVAWQLSASGARRAVPCRFVLRGREVSFALGAGYDPAQRLVIDPVLVFATYSGSPGGMSANCTAADAAGNMYTGSYVLGPGYPVTLGAIKSSYSPGNIGISKLSATGSNLLYATYLGGNGNGTSDDYPLDFELNAAGELLVLAATISADYPTTATAFDRTLGTSGGGFARDLAVTRFNATGTAILASTFLGGSGEEAGNTSLVPAALALDPAGDVLVVSSTVSADYPVLNAAQPTRSGGTDGVLTRLAPDFSRLRWSTYLGGTVDDRAHDVKVAPNGDVYVCGSTLSFNMPVGTGGLLPNAPGGQNGFVLRYSAAGSRLAGTFLGTAGSDAARFLDFDAAGNVLVAGASDGAYPRTAGTFGAVAPNTTGVFLHGMSSGLNSTIFSTQISVLGLSQLNGFSGSNVATAFGRDNCGRLYLSAYAGTIASPGCPLTPGALFTQPRTMYLATLAENATALLYSTFLGEPNQSQSISFGTHPHFAAANYISRAGVLYHVTCSTGRAFGTTPGAYSAGLTFSNDAAAFKFDLAPTSAAGVLVAVATPPPSCAPYAVQFVNNSSSPLLYSWDFGDGSPLDTARAPRHTYAVAGTYTARLVGTRRSTGNVCGAGTASISVPVVVLPPVSVRLVADSLGCGRPLVLDPTRLMPFVSGIAYAWSNGARTPFITVTAPGRYRVEVDQGQTCPAVVEFVIREAAVPRVRTVVDSLSCGLLSVLDPARAFPQLTGTAYRWNTGAQTRTLPITTPGRYRLEIEQGRFCPAVVEFDVTLSQTFRLPNVMTVNGDKLNAVLKIPASYGTPALKVFNRWGRLVYETTAYRNDWTGTDQPAGTYYYQLTQPACGINLKGWVEIIR